MKKELGLLVYLRKIIASTTYHLAPLFPDDLYVRILFWAINGYKLDLHHPKTFCEKIQWLKLNDHRDIYHKMVDKLEAKVIVSNLAGTQVIIPTLAIWNSIDEIDIANLPKSFVLKSTAGGGNNGVVICKDKASFNLEDAKCKLKNSSKVDIYKTLKEWVYKDIKPRFFAEQLISEESSEELTDYKIYCFNGDPKYIQVIKDRNKNETIDFYDINWVHQDFIGLNPVAVPSSTTISQPLNLNEMLDLAKVISKDIPFLRVDLYNIKGRVLFGETTFYPASGFGRFTPFEWDLRLGNLISINT